MYKIMIADDEGIVIDSLKFIIEKEFKDECVIESAKTGRSVIELAEWFRPDIAFMDIQMPGINGIDVMREIRENNSRTIFVVVSAYDKFDYAKEAINLGVMEYLNKPIEKSGIVSVLKKAMAKIDREREKRSSDLMIREKMEAVVPIIENGFIYNLLFQENFTEDIENYKTLIGVTAEYGYMVVLVFGERQEGSHMTNAVGASIRMQNYYAKIRDLVTEYFPNIIMGTTMANKIAMLVPCETGTISYEERIEIIDHTRKLCRKLQEKTDVAFRIGIGSVELMKDAIVSYNEALGALVQTRGSVAHVEDVGYGCEYEENYPIELERRLFEAVDHGKLDEAVMTVNQFFDWMEENYSDCVMDIKLKSLEFVLWAEHIAYEKGGFVYEFRSRSDYLPKLLDYSSLAQVRSWFVDKVADACRKVLAKKEGKSGSSVIENAKRYIRDNFKKDISLDDVSKEVQISPYYFSKLFKEETGQNFIEYLTNARIEEAKHLLQETDMSMKEIGVMTGYSDPNYFSRIFKKTIGVTPTEFKESKGAHVEG